jgi:hypothetical protein
MNGEGKLEIGCVLQFVIEGVFQTSNVFDNELHALKSYILTLSPLIMYLEYFWIVEYQTKYVSVHYQTLLHNP